MRRITVQQIKIYNFKLRITGNGPALLSRCINLNNIAPDITFPGIWGFLFFTYLLPVKTGPASPANLGILAIHIHYVTTLLNLPIVLLVKNLAMQYPLGKPLGMGLAKPS